MASLQSGGYGTSAPPTSTAAIVSLLFGILGWFTAPVICSIIAIVAGYRACREIAASNERVGGSGYATAGIITGHIQLALIAFLCALLFVIFLLTETAGSEWLYFNYRFPGNFRPCRVHTRRITNRAATGRASPQRFRCAATGARLRAGDRALAPTTADCVSFPKRRGSSAASLSRSSPSAIAFACCPTRSGAPPMLSAPVHRAMC